MNGRIAMRVGLLAMACRTGPDGAPSAAGADGTDTRPPLDTPWEAATEPAGAVSGAFNVVLDDPGPGGGWFAGDGLEGAAFARGALHAGADGDWPVVSVRIHGHDPAEGWTVLELDIALPAHVAGEVPVDGASAVGLLTLPDGAQRAALDGTLTLEQAGAEPGQRVVGRFDELPLWSTP